ncbi:hypothetical protein ACKWTF_001344 [Chironomus riparius]
MTDLLPVPMKPGNLYRISALRRVDLASTIGILAESWLNPQHYIQYSSINARDALLNRSYCTNLYKSYGFCSYFTLILLFTGNPMLSLNVEPNFYDLRSK